MGKTCVCGAEALDIDADARTARVQDDHRSTRATCISIDGSTGEVFLGELPVVAPPVVTYLEDGLDAALARPTTRPGPGARRRPAAAPRRPHAAAAACGPTPTPPRTPARARRLGAEGIGLSRTEHMFLGDRRALIERADPGRRADAEREAALAALLPLQREDFVELLEAMDGLPVTIRLLDPPLHEFLPDRTELAVRVAVAKATGDADPTRRAPARRRRAAARVQPDARACAACGSGWSCRGSSPCRCARSRRPPRSASATAATRRWRSWCRSSGR